MNCWWRERHGRATATGLCVPVRIARMLGENGENGGENHVHQHVLDRPVLFEKTIHIRGRKKAKVACSTRGRSQPRQTRDAQVVVRAARVTLRPPWRADRKLPPVTVNVVLVSEVNPPVGEVPVRVVSAEQLADRHPGAGTADHPILLCAVDG